MTASTQSAAGKLVLGVPSKGRLMEDSVKALAERGFTVKKSGHARGYRGIVEEDAGIEVAFVSASEIASLLSSGAIHFGITGEDLIRETIASADDKIEFTAKLGFGHADVVVAVPDFWIDVRTMADLDAMAMPFRRHHGRWLRVATKYLNLTRRFFDGHGVADYRLVESLGATEGTPASGAADLIVDITSTGETLRANGLRILDDGVILRSEANLVASRAAAWTAETEVIAAPIRKAFAGR